MMAVPRVVPCCLHSVPGCIKADIAILRNCSNESKNIFGGGCVYVCVCVCEVSGLEGRERLTECFIFLKTYSISIWGDLLSVLWLVLFMMGVLVLGWAELICLWMQSWDPLCLRDYIGKPGLCRIHSKKQLQKAAYFLNNENCNQKTQERLMKNLVSFVTKISKKKNFPLL